MMSLSVSRDSGKTWSATVEYTLDLLRLPLASSTWPPCQCPRCIPAREADERSLARAVRRQGAADW